MLMGDTFFFFFEAKTIVPAINEVYNIAKFDTNVQIMSEPVINNIEKGIAGDLGVTKQALYEKSGDVFAFGYMIASSNPTIAGIYHYVGPCAGGDFPSYDTPMFKKEDTVDTYLYWTAYNANPNVPRAGYWYIGPPSTNYGVQATQHMTPYRPQSANAFASAINAALEQDKVTLLNTWANSAGLLGLTGTWINVQSITGVISASTSEKGWTQLFNVSTDDHGKLTVRNENGDDWSISAPPAAGTWVLKSVDGNISWATP
jgi:hypothetical protein